jgi:hypothetical protein
VTGYDDPGWGPALKLLVPYAVFLKRVRKPAWQNVLLNLRFVHVAFVSAPFLYLFVLPVLVTGAASTNGTSLAAMAVLSAAALGLLAWVRGRPLALSSESDLVRSYRTNYFLSVAAAEAPALIGFALAIVTRSISPYLIGMLAMLLGMVLAAPSRRDIARRQEEIAERGSTLSVGAALIRHPARFQGRGR